jgi:hypothetical protein
MAQHWFSDLMGCQEAQWDFSQIPASVETGEFATPSIRELSKLCKPWLLPTRSSEEPRPFKCLIRTANIRPDLFDTSSVQLFGPPRTLVQVASNFNCLELASPLVNPFSGRYLTKLMVDKTQGPSAAAGAGAGAIGILARHRAQEIDLLQDVPLTHANGKLYFSAEEGDDPNFDPDLVRVGLLSDVRASFDRSLPNKCVHHADGPLIDQVFVSTVIMPPGAAHTPELIAVSQKLLRAAYRGTYLAAVERRSPRLLLTLVGGGSFRNRDQDIVAALAAAHAEFGPFLTPECEVELRVFEVAKGGNGKWANLLQKAIPDLDLQIIDK